jgi:hypothetical protein
VTPQPSVGPWSLFRFLYPIHSRQDSLNGDQPVARPLHRQTCLESDLSIRAGEDGSCLIDYAATVIDRITHTLRKTRKKVYIIYSIGLST